jgi:hypothetical protein
MEKSELNKIISAFDDEIIKTGKSYLTLQNANKILSSNQLMTDEEINNQELKRILNKDLIPHAYQTKNTPKQWRIPLSKQGTLVLNERSIKKLSNVSEIDSNDRLFTCPSCNSIMKFSDSDSPNKAIECKKCGRYIKTKKLLETFELNKEKVVEIKDDVNWIKVISVIIFIAACFLIFTWINEKKSNNYSDSRYYNEHRHSPMEYNYNSFEAKLVKQFPNLVYSVIHIDDLHDIKFTIDIRLSKACSDSEIKQIAIFIKDHLLKKDYERIFIGYYLPGDQINSGYWATSNFIPDLLISSPN